MAKDIGDSNLIDVWGATGNVVEPDISKIDEGWQLGEQPPHEFMNWLQNTFGEKLNHVLSRGAVDWNSETPFPAGSLVIRNGRTWAAVQPNVNSEPSDSSSNWREVGKNTANSITVTVGAGGDYPTINAALNDLSKLTPIYKNTGVIATVHLLAGFVMAEQVIVRGVDLGWITITGADAQTVIDHTALTINATTTDYVESSFPAFCATRGGSLPTIGQLFAFSAANVGGSKDGISAWGVGSRADVLAGCGVRLAGRHGFFASGGSTINAEGANASGAGDVGILAARGSTINAEGTNASGAGDVGILAARGSTVNAQDANASGAGKDGILAARGSTINAEGANARKGAVDSSTDFVVSSGSTIAANGATGGTVIAANTVTASGIIFK
jgi:hypothetical protein